MKNCPICDSSSFEKIVFRTNVPVHENLIYETTNEAKQIPTGEILSMMCKQCNFVFNQKFDLSKLSYGDGYNNSQNSSKFFKDHVDSLIQQLISKTLLEKKRILEIGCGDGYFLKKLLNETDKNFGIGYDPSYNESNESLDDIRIEKKFFDDTCKEDADLIISRHTIEHIPEPIKFLKDIRKISKLNTRIFIETPDVEWILKNSVFWDITYEHCSFFSKNSISTALQISGFQINSIKKIFNNQYMWIEAIPSNSTNITFNNSLNSFVANFSEKYEQKQNEFQAKILNFRKKGNVAVWGAAGKGVNFTNMLDPNHDLIDCLIDLNPKKWGKFIAGTGHEIINFTDIENREINTAIVMNPNYFDEISSLVKENNLQLELVNTEIF